MTPEFADQRAGNFNDDFKIHVDFKKNSSVSKKNIATSFFSQRRILNFKDFQKFFFDFTKNFIEVFKIFDDF
jgi:hypothetical protein